MGRRRRKQCSEPDYLVSAMRLHQRSHLFLEDVPLEEIEQILIAFEGNEEDAIAFLEEQWASYPCELSDCSDSLQWDDFSDTSDSSDFYDHFDDYNNCDIFDKYGPFPARQQCQLVEGFEGSAPPPSQPTSRFSIWPHELRAISKEVPATLRLQADRSMKFECLRENIGRIVGLKGATCKRILKETGCEVDVDRDCNIVTIVGPSVEAMQRAHRMCLNAARDSGSTPSKKIRRTCGGRKKKSKQRVKQVALKDCSGVTNSRGPISKMPVKKLLKAGGWKCVRRNNHAVFKRDVGNGTIQTISCSLTPSDCRASTKIKLDLRSMDEERDRILATRLSCDS